MRSPNFTAAPCDAITIALPFSTLPDGGIQVTATWLALPTKARILVELPSAVAMVAAIFGDTSTRKSFSGMVRSRRETAVGGMPNSMRRCPGFKSTRTKNDSVSVYSPGLGSTSV